ncbi:MAG: phycobiliprotein lyase [Gloeomargarita sp. SKYBB_i_bin120]|nr:phycobiliprotein lyase [Gloeomargarita sp. SKYG98]MCS7293132.1 phycobiliprotein lyase [Gloeomargarita sp. SKYB120]MDW8178697.1 phycobiliprotein lyase [Gloeomargarita sp. SKYBB_i_bin120]
MNARDFFARSDGVWHSQRVTHHLAFRQTELGQSRIWVTTLPLDDPAVQAVCAQHQCSPTQASGASRVEWQGVMGWDREGEQQNGSTVMVLIPADERSGRLLREVGYAEKSPVAGLYQMDETGAMTLTTEYATLRSQERLWFEGEHIRLRASTLGYGFGGTTMATFAVETRVGWTPAARSATALPTILGW